MFSPYLRGHVMSSRRVAALGAIFICLSLSFITAASAQALREADGPVNFPPKGFKGKQFVDNDGCAFVRAGIDGRVTWVPRVTRSRQLLCGLKPSFAGAEATITQAPRAAQIVQIQPKALPPAQAGAQPTDRATDRATAQPIAQAPAAPLKAAPKKAAPVPRKTSSPAAKPAPKRAPKPALAAKPQVAKQQAKKPAPQRAAQPSPAQPKLARTKNCPNFTGISARYAGQGAGVRCGPQAQSPSRARPQVTQTDPATGQRRVIPKHVYDAQQRQKSAVKIPEGYRKAWEDDRLNTQRAHMTEKGIQQADLLWTRTLPRRLYIKETGRVVNNLFPDLRYPYTSMQEQNAAMGFAASATPPTLETLPGKPRQPKTQPQTQPGGRFVQVGLFGKPGNAQRAARQISAAGLPARLGTLTKGSKRYTVVMAGPFAPNQIKRAVAAARRAGFHDAYAR